MVVRFEVRRRGRPFARLIPAEDRSAKSDEAAGAHRLAGGQGSTAGVRSAHGADNENG